MAIDLQNPTNIGTGWGPPPQFHAPEIGGLVGHILQNRILQKAQQDKEIADAIKQYQTEREDSAYTEALRNAGLTQGQDISGLGSKQATSLAQLVAATTKDTDADNLKKAMANYYNAGAALGGRGRSRASGSMVTVPDDNGDPVLDANGDPVQVPSGSRLGQHIISQQNAMLNAPSASVAANIATKMGIPPQAVTDTGVHAGMGLVPGSGVDKYGQPYETKYMPVSPGDEPTDIQVSPRGTDPKTQQPYAPVIVQKDTLEQLRRALQGPTYKPPRGPQPGDVNDQTPLPQSVPSATPRPNQPPPADSAGGHTPDYGVPAAIAPSRDKAVAGQTYYAPDGSVRVRGTD